MFQQHKWLQDKNLRQDNHYERIIIHQTEKNKGQQQNQVMSVKFDFSTMGHASKKTTKKGISHC